MHRSISKGTKDLLLFKMPMQEANVLETCLICTFQVRFSSIYTPRDFVNSSCFIELPSIVKDGSLLKVFNLCLEPININSVFDLLRVILFADYHSVILVRPLFPYSELIRSNDHHKPYNIKPSFNNYSI